MYASIAKKQQQTTLPLQGLSAFIPYSDPLLGHLLAELPGIFFLGVCFLLISTSTLWWHTDV